MVVINLISKQNMIFFKIIQGNEVKFTQQTASEAHQIVYFKIKHITLFAAPGQ
jgi:hypothetical protein